MMRRRPLCLLTLAQTALILIFYLAGIPFLTDPPDLEEVRDIVSVPRTVRVEGIVSGYEFHEDYRTLTVRRASLQYKSDVYSIGTVKCTWNDAEDPGLRAGYAVALTGVVKETAKAENPGQFDAASWYALQGIFFRMKEPNVTLLRADTDVFRQTILSLRTAAAEHIRAVYPEDVSGILCAMLIGDRTALDEDTKSLWRTGGVAHMLAISGMHLTVLGMGLFRAFRKLTISLIKPVRKMRNPQIPACVLSSAAMVLYTVFTGMSVSTVRACIMFLLVIGGKASGRTYDPPTGLAVAVSLILLESPYYLMSSGFLLSVTAVLVTFVFHDRSKFMTALFLYLWMLPLISIFYYEIPTLSILVNLLAVPFLPVILGSGMAGCAAAGTAEIICRLDLLGTGMAGRAAAAEIPGWIRTAAAAPATYLIRALNLLLKKTAAFPRASVITGCPAWWKILIFYAALFIWTVRITKVRRTRRRFFLLPLAPAIALILLIRIPGTLKMTFLSVGQGDSICLEMPSGAAALVDGGSSSVMDVGTNRILPFLKYEGIRKLDYVFVTHLDLDHYSGISELLGDVRDRKTTLKVGAVVLPALAHKDDAYVEMEQLALDAGARVLHVRDGDSFRNGDVRVEVLNPHPENETVTQDTNAQCIVLGVHFGNFDALLTGDVCGKGEESVADELLSEQKTESTHYELLKVAHHGSRYSTPEEFLAMLDPDVSVISVGADNRYGHPHRLLLERLEAQRTKILRTDEDGAVTVTTRGRRWRVSEFM